MFGEHHDHGTPPRPFDLRIAGASDPTRPATTSSLARQLARGESRAAVSFGGQGAAWLPELADLLRAEPSIAPWIAAAEDVLEAMASARESRWSGLLDSGVALTALDRFARCAPMAKRCASSRIRCTK